MIETEINSLMEKTATGWSCRRCDYVTKNKQNLVNHIESKHVNIGGAPCEYCDKVCPTRHALQMHTLRQHPSNVPCRV